eukprot:COSAG04_NODE_781_length_10327_cov_151.194466_11_plen_198_part_00
MDTLGELASLGHAVFARQTLVGGNYELLRCSSGQDTGPEPGAGCDFEPHPDYWVALLWHRLMGTAALPAPTLSGADGGSAGAAEHDLRLRAHCTPNATRGAVTIAFANMAESATYTLALPASWGARAEYHLTAANATEGFAARTLSLNAGPPLRTGAGADVLPPLRPATQPGAAPAQLAPVSLGFLVFADAGAAACS